MFAKRRKHNLPSFPPSAAGQFRRLCQALPPHTLPQLRRELDEYYESVLDVAKNRPLVNITLIRELYDRAGLLLGRYVHLKERERSLVVGALRYFVAAEDGFNDLEFASGYNDDAQVMNFVLEELGLEDEYIQY
jgi:hypothetical protein